MRPWLPFTIAVVSAWSIAGCSTQTSATDESGTGPTSAGQNNSPAMEPPSVENIKFDGRTPPQEVAGYSLVSDEEVEALGRELFEQKGPATVCGIADIGLVLEDPTHWLNSRASSPNAREAYSAYFLKRMEANAELYGWGGASRSVVFYSSDWDNRECVVVTMERLEGSPQAFDGMDYGIREEDKLYSVQSSPDVPDGDSQAVLNGVVNGLAGPSTMDGIYFAP